MFYTENLLHTTQNHISFYGIQPLGNIPNYIFVGTYYLGIRYQYISVKLMLSLLLLLTDVTDNNEYETLC